MAARSRTCWSTAEALDRAAASCIGSTPPISASPIAIAASPEDWIFVGARLARQRRASRPRSPRAWPRSSAAREATPAVRARTGGSTFANPPGHKAWELIDAAGCRGLRIGGAQVSEKHCNFLINTGDATAADIEALGEEVRRRVLRASGVDAANGKSAASACPPATEAAA